MNNLIPFDLEKALAGEPVITRDGRPVDEVHLFKTDTTEYPLRYVTEGKTLCCDKSGRYWANGAEVSGDLFMAPKPVEIYSAVYAAYMGEERRCKEDAILHADKSALSICKLTILNGEVVSAETVHKYSNQ